MAFHERPWSTREAVLGDEAEQVFESVQTSGFARHGLLRPRVQVHKLHPLVRYEPDYVRTNDLVEVMGAGRDQTLKLKVEKLSALQLWDQFMPTRMFVWDSAQRRHGEFPIKALSLGGVTISTFHEGKDYFALPLDLLPMDGGWTHVEEA